MHVMLHFLLMQHRGNIDFSVLNLSKQHLRCARGYFNESTCTFSRNFRRRSVSSRAEKQRILFPEFCLSLRIELKLCPARAARVPFAQWNSKNRFGKWLCIKAGTIRSDVKNAIVARWYRNAHSNSFRAYRHVAAQVEVHARWRMS